MAQTRRMQLSRIFFEIEQLDLGDKIHPGYNGWHEKRDMTSGMGINREARLLS